MSKNKHTRNHVKQHTKQHTSRTITLHSLEDAIKILNQIAKNRFSNLSKLGEEDAKQFIAFVASISNMVNAQAKQENGTDRRNEWIGFLELSIKEAFEKKDIGAVLTYSQNILFICEQMIEEGHTELMDTYSRRMINLSVLHERLNMKQNNVSLAARAGKYIEKVTKLEELEFFIGVIEKDAIYQFSNKNFELSSNNHLVIFNARKKALNSEEFLSSKEGSSKQLKISQIKTAGNLVAALTEEGRVDEALTYFSEGVVYEQDAELNDYLETPDGNRAIAGLYMNTSACYDRKKDRVKEKELLEKAKLCIQQNEEKDEEDNNSSNALLRRRINCLLQLNEEGIWFSSSQEYQNKVKEAINIADTSLKDCINGKESPEAAQRIEEAIEELEQLHAVDLIISSVRFAKFCQLCGDLHRRFKDANSINRYWYQKTVDILRGLQQDDISFDLNDLALSLFFLAIYERETDLEGAIEHQKQSIFLSEQLMEKGKIRDKNNLAMGYHNLAVSLANKGEANETLDYAQLALNLWNQLIEKENRKELQSFIEPCKNLIQWASEHMN
jgi:hypothetical protein